MAAPAILKLDIIADATKATAALNKTSTQAKTTSQKLSGIGKAVAGAFAGAVVFNQAKQMVTAASDLNETMSKTQVAFGASAKSIVAWSKDSATAFGLSQNEALTAAATFQTMFTQVGIGGEQSAKMSKGIVKISADLASFHNVAGGAAEVTDLISSAMRGEYDSLQRLIPTINAAKVQQKALAMTGKTNAKQLTDAEKAAATYQLVLEGAGKATGDFARTSDGLANQQRIASAQWKDAQAQIGNAFLPVIAKLAAVFTTTLLPAIKAIIDSGLAPWLIAAAAAIWLVNIALAANPFILIAIAVVAFVAAIVLAYQKVGWFRAAVQAAFAIISGIFRAWWAYVTTVFNGVAAAFNVFWNVIKTVFNWIKSNWPLLLAVLTGPIGIAATLILSNWSKIKNAATDLYQWVKGKFDALVGAISAAAGALDRIVDGIVAAIKAPINAVIRAWNSFRFPTFDIPKISTPIGDIGGGSWGGWSLPHIDTLQRGGVVLRSGLARVHEGEVFSGVGKTFGGTTVINVHVTTTGLGADSPQIQRQLVTALKGYVARNGPLNVPVRTVA